MKIVSIVGARPNFIKIAPLSRALRGHFDEILVHTGQHYDYLMDKVFFEELGIPSPNYHLGVGSGTHGQQTGEMLKRLEGVLLEEKPSLVLVIGDTNTTLAGGLAAVKLRIPLAHVESGLRSFDRRMPEEINRVLTDHCADHLFCPTPSSLKNLSDEGITKNCHLTGDVMVDAMKDHLRIAGEKSHILDELGLEPQGYYLATIHRAENTDDLAKLTGIVDAFCQVEGLVFPCHPRTEKILKSQRLWDRLNGRVKIIKPVGYLDMLILEKNAKKILTDSGGVQKEAYILSIPCITLRENTEWVETVQDEWNVLVGSDTSRIIKMIDGFNPSTPQKNLFGEGNASDNIKKVLHAIL